MVNLPPTEGDSVATMILENNVAIDAEVEDGAGVLQLGKHFITFEFLKEVAIVAFISPFCFNILAAQAR